MKVNKVPKLYYKSITIDNVIKKYYYFAFKANNKFSL